MKFGIWIPNCSALTAAPRMMSGVAKCRQLGIQMPNFTVALLTG